MSEIKTEIVATIDEDGEEQFVIDVNHTIADIMRWIEAQGWLDDFHFCSCGESFPRQRITELEEERVGVDSVLRESIKELGRLTNNPMPVWKDSGKISVTLVRYDLEALTT